MNIQLKKISDHYICSIWKEIYDKNIIWYKLENLQEIKLEGINGLIVQENPLRLTKQRKININGIAEKGHSFNFSKVSNHEVITEFQISDKKFPQTICVKIIVNIAPIHYYHSLIIPNSHLINDQNASLDGLLTCYHFLMNIETNRKLYIGFNHIGSFSSVNHEHYHIFFYEEKLLIDQILNKPVIINHPKWRYKFIQKYEDYFIPCLIVQIEPSNYENVIVELMDFFNHFKSSMDFSYNFIMRKKFDGCEMIIFTKKYMNEPLVIDINCEYTISSAFLELCGFIVIKDFKALDYLNENKLIESIRSTCMKIEDILNNDCFIT